LTISRIRSSKRCTTSRRAHVGHGLHLVDIMVAICLGNQR
jgi:hypothetical protein